MRIQKYLNVPRHTNILFDGLIENLFWNMIQQNGEQYLLSVILYDYVGGIFKVKRENLFWGH